MGVEREQLRISDAERQAAAEWLGAAFRDGRLDTYEYDERLGRAYSAMTYGDLDRLFTDLPRPVASGYAPMPAPRAYAYPQPRGPVGEVRGRRCRSCCSSSRSGSGATSTSSRPMTR